MEQNVAKEERRETDRCLNAACNLIHYQGREWSLFETISFLNKRPSPHQSAMFEFSARRHRRGNKEEISNFAEKSILFECGKDAEGSSAFGRGTDRSSIAVRILSTSLCFGFVFSVHYNFPAFCLQTARFALSRLLDLAEELKVWCGAVWVEFKHR